MTLTDLAEVAVPKRAVEPILYRLRRGVRCNACGSKEVMLNDNTIVCAGCFDEICVICGCVESYACDEGCSWLLPGVCSTHEDDPRLARLAIQATPEAALSLLN